MSTPATFYSPVRIIVCRWTFDQRAFGMKKGLGNMKRFLLMLILGLSGLILMACQRDSGITKVERQDDGSWDITLRISEADTQEIVKQAMANDPRWDDLKADLRDGEIYVEGTYRAESTNQPVSGNYTFAFKVVDGLLIAEVSSLNIEGIGASQSGLQDINEALSESTINRAEREGDGLKWLSVDMTNNYVELKFNVKDRNN